MDIYYNTKIFNSRNTLGRSSDLNLIQEYSNKDTQFFSLYNNSGISIEYTTEDYNKTKRKKRLYNYSTDIVESHNNLSLTSAISRLPKPLNENIIQEISLIRSLPDNSFSLLLNRKKFNFLRAKLQSRIYARFTHINGKLELPLTRFNTRHCRNSLYSKLSYKHVIRNQNLRGYISGQNVLMHKIISKDLSKSRYTAKYILRKQKALVKKKKIRNHFRYYLITGRNYRRIWKRMYYKIIRKNKNKLRNYYKSLRNIHMHRWTVLINSYQLYKLYISEKERNTGTI